MEDTMRELLSKLDAILNETALNPNDPKGDYDAKRKALQDIQINPETSKDKDLRSELVRRLSSLEKEAKEAGIKESSDAKNEQFQIGDKIKYGIYSSPGTWDEAEITDIINNGDILVVNKKDGTVDQVDLNQQALGISKIQKDDKRSWVKDPSDPDSKIPAYLRKSKESSKKQAQQTADRLNKELGADVWRSPRESLDSDQIFKIGDAFGISVNEDLEIDTEIVDIIEDGVIIELDETAINYLSENGFTFEDGEVFEGEQHGNSKIYDKCWKGYKKVPGKKRGEPRSCEKIGESGLQYYTGKKKYGKDGMAALAKAGRDGANEEELGRIKDKYKKEDYEIDEAEYHGRKVPLGKPMKGDVKKSKVYVKNPQGNVVKVNFGDKNMKIKKSNPARRKSFRARHNCANPGPRHKARYWSCRAW